LNADREDPDIGGVGAGQALDLVEQVGELGAAALEGIRVHVRQVVGDRIDVDLLRRHPGGGGPHGSDHLKSPVMSDQ
jgi:hypothetical protein